MSLDWFKYDGSSILEEQVKYNIAVSCEGFINSCYDLGEDSGWYGATKEFWTKGIYQNLQEEYNVGGTTYMLNGEGSHLRFYGKKNTLKLIDEYLENYDDVKEFIKCQ